MSWVITKSFTFDAAHRLPHVPAGHKCGVMHGHTYMVDVELTANQLQDGMVFEYGDLAAVVRPLTNADHPTKTRDCLDHTTLNGIPGLENPTTEVLAQWIFNRLRARIPFLSAVTVHESSTTKCTYRPE